MSLLPTYDKLTGAVVGCKRFKCTSPDCSEGYYENVPLDLCKKSSSQTQDKPIKMTAISKFSGFMGMDGSPMGYLPLGIGALGGIAGFMLHKKYPKFGMAGKVGYIAVGAAAGYFITKEVMKKKAQS